VSHPFQGAAVPALYSGEDRTLRRSGALLAAKTAGRNINDVVLGHADSACLPNSPAIVDIGCGQGRATVRLAHHYPAATIAAIDASPAMTAATRERTTGLNVQPVTADFHALPLLDDSTDLAIAIMCLYHSPTPQRVISEISRVLRPTGTTILVTKATDSYQELADLLQRTDLDPDAHNRPSLYEAAHSGNLRRLAEAGALTVQHVEHEVHTFTFTDLAHAAAYLSTCPQYVLPEPLREPDRLTEALRACIPDKPVTTTATISYLVGRPA
jgi:ubiquinone/menaquinone biosynthesis C-methylase UbiE